MCTQTNQKTGKDGYPDSCAKEHNWSQPGAKRSWPHYQLRLLSCLLALLYCFLLFSSPASAHTGTLSVGPTIQLNMGFEMSYRQEEWTPVIVTLNNDGPRFTGKLTVNVYTGPPNLTYIAQISPWSFEQPVTLAEGEYQRITIYVPFNFSNYVPRGVIANLSDSHDQIVASQISSHGYDVPPNDLLIGLLTSPAENFNALNTATLPNQTSSLTTSQLDASTFPSISSALDAFDVIILDNFATNTLSQKQLAALQTWVNQGGLLIEVGGANWQQTLAPLPSTMLPITLTGTDTLPGGSQLFPADGQTSSSSATTLKKALSISTAAIDSSTLNMPLQSAFSSIQTLVTSDGTPLLVEAHQGRGLISYLAFDPAFAPLATWSGTSALWSAILMHALGEQFLIPGSTRGYDSGPGQLLLHGGILRMIEPQTLAGPWQLAIMILCYLAIIGPIRLLVIKYWHLPKWWGWRIFLASIVLFSLFAYGLASSLQSAAFTDNSIELIQLNQDSSYAHITSYMGLFVPATGDMQIHIPGTNLTQPVNSQLLTDSFLPFIQEDPAAVIVPATKGTTLTLQNLSQWTYHPVVTQQDRQLSGNIIAHLSLHNTAITGTITNTLPTALSDVYLVCAQGFVRIGHLASGATYHVNTPLYTVLHRSGQPLAEQINQQAGLPSTYFPYDDNQQPQNDFQRHMALLSALNGSGFTYPPCNGSCNTNALITRQAIFPSGANANNIQGNATAYDPLLIPGAPLTLIGWTDRQITGQNDITLNGIHPNGFHESFLQMPIMLDTSDTNSMPANFTAGHVIDIQSYDAHLVLPGVYSMATGSLTFEFDVPISRSSGLSITVPQYTKQATRGTASNHLWAHLYNWLTHSWDPITFIRNVYRTTNIAAYSSPTGRVLLQISSTNKAQVDFSTPSISLFALS
jgi:hypothetical protein